MVVSGHADSMFFSSFFQFDVDEHFYGHRAA